MLNVIMLNVANNPFLLSVVMLNAIMLNVVAPVKCFTVPKPTQTRSPYGTPL